MSILKQAADAGTTGSRSRPVGKWLCIAFVVLLLVAGGFLSLSKITRESLWVDEYWAVYLATGRGSAIFDLPQGRFFNPPPATNFTQAPPIWRIYTGLGTTPHPPVYHLLLRLWVDLFGDGDLAVRCLSAVCGLGAGLLLFSVIKPQFGRWVALGALAIMVFAPLQIDFRQQARPYTLIILVGLVLCKLVLSVEQNGMTRLRRLGLTASAFVLVLTHYFALGAVAAVTCYCAIRLRGRTRSTAILSILFGVALAALVWGPVAWMTHRELIIAPEYGLYPSLSRWRALLTIPQRMIVNSGSAAMTVGLFVAVGITIFQIKRPAVFFWWLWVACTIGVVAVFDIARARGSVLLGVDRQVLLASPGIYALVCSLATTRWGAPITGAAVLAAIVFGIGRCEAGPGFSESTRNVAKTVQELVRPEDGVVIIGHFPSEPAFRYVVLGHYAGDWKNPVAFVVDPIGPSMQTQMRRFSAVWVVGYDASDIRSFPGWKVEHFHGIAPGYCLFSITPEEPVAIRLCLKTLWPHDGTESAQMPGTAARAGS